MKLFVGGLAFAATVADLEEVFGEFGMIREVKIITDRETGMSRGFAFVTFERAEDAEKALPAMNGQKIAGRTIRVDHAENKPRDGREGRGRPPMSRTFPPQVETVVRPNAGAPPSDGNARRRAPAPEREFVDRGRSED